MIEEEKKARVRREQEFYAKCGELLGLEHVYNVPFERKTRWNQRNPGNGRYEGFGVIRRYSSTLIHVMSKDTNETFTSEEKVYEYLLKL